MPGHLLLDERAHDRRRAVAARAADRRLEEGLLVAGEALARADVEVLVEDGDRGVEQAARHLGEPGHAVARDEGPAQRGAGGRGAGARGPARHGGRRARR